jgi:hypothetical protein
VRWEVLLLLALLLLAAVTRLPGLEERGRWDADQGHDMLVLRALVMDGEIPLVGPLTSAGTFHHGAIYYYLLAPAALASGADPVAVTAWIALFGIGAVAATWWLGRLVGGPLAGALAGLLAAVSPAGIDESTFIWNPNLIPVAAALAFAGALHARQTGRDRWWLLAAAGAMVTMQCHILGAVILPPLVVAWVAEVRRRRQAGASVRPLVMAGAGGLAILAAGYAPLVVSELRTGFGEARAVIDYLGGGQGSSAPLVTRVGMVAWRSVTWPLVGLITDRLVLTAVATVVFAGLATVATLVGRAADRAAVRWLLATLAWSAIALAIFAPSLATVTPGLPNDHYHAFLDPLVLALAGVGLARVAAGSARRPVLPSRVAAGALAGVLVVIGMVAWPPRVADDGGWRMVDQAAARVARTAGTALVGLDGIPAFKSADALRFPLLRRDARLLPEDVDVTTGIGEAEIAVVVCDPLFEDVVGVPCGGPAEDAWATAVDTGPGAGAGEQQAGLRLVDRYAAGPRREISVYAMVRP